MSSESERVIGMIPVVARLALGIEQLILFVTDARIIFARVGKRGAGALATSALFGRMSGGFEDLLKSGTESRSKRALPHLTPQKILKANKDNFHLRFDEIVSLRVVEMPSTTDLTLLTTADKFDLRTALPVDEIIGLLQIPLGSKMSVVNLPPGVRSRRER